MRLIVEAILCLLRGGLPWQFLLPGFSLLQTLQSLIRLEAAHRGRLWVWGTSANTVK